MGDIIMLLEVTNRLDLSLLITDDDEPNVAAVSYRSAMYVLPGLLHFGGLLVPNVDRERARNHKRDTIVCIALNAPHFDLPLLLIRINFVSEIVE